MYYMSALSQIISGIFKTGSYIRDIIDMFMCVLNFCYIYISLLSLLPCDFFKRYLLRFYKQRFRKLRHNEYHKMYELY